MDSYTKDYSYSSIRRKAKKQAELDLNTVYNNLPARTNFCDVKQLVQQEDITLLKDEQVFFKKITSTNTQTTDFNLQSNFSSETIRDLNFANDNVNDIDSEENNYVSSSSDNQDENFDGEINNILRDWSLQYKITHVALASLLCILKPYFPTLPQHPRTLLKTPTIFEVKKLKSGGDYCHIGLENGLKNCINDLFIPENTNIHLQINIDGLPLFNSSGVSVWPILCIIKNFSMKEPFVVGIYSGKEKPPSAAEFLEEFVEETKHLVDNGFLFNNKRYSVKIHSFICDAPARAFVKGIKGHSGYNSCEKCTTNGEYDGKLIYPETNAPLRTDLSFFHMIDKKHHLWECPLKLLNVGFVSQFGLDYMHLVCLGVMKRLILYWKDPKGPLHV
ncbi:uncharacterized protein LOC101239790 [Hydra vulgaris]|uniref:uncharacterized protein LOC101239790 n=1 Tax=Hydra vulgaris TaxID=6087 RepID=UPI001F5F160D|nr:uncharacterized protein LOC101239790 [Hydra vulgaris]XP_047143868.1 uncharacterized protein LOC101239790 [Hydra vulgaris]